MRSAGAAGTDHSALSQALRVHQDEQRLGVRIFGGRWCGEDHSGGQTDGGAGRDASSTHLKPALLWRGLLNGQGWVLLLGLLLLLVFLLLLLLDLLLLLTLPPSLPVRRPGLLLG